MWICNLAWEQSKIPEDWRKAIFVPLYNGRGNREECNNCKGISLLCVPGKIYGRILNERMMKITDKSVEDEQGGFWKGRKCIDQIFAVKILVEKYLEKDPSLPEVMEVKVNVDSFWAKRGFSSKYGFVGVIEL